MARKQVGVVELEKYFQEVMIKQIVDKSIQNVILP